MGVSMGTTLLNLLILGLTLAQDVEVYQKNNWTHPALPSTCGMQMFARVVGGEETLLGEFPWMALLEYSTPNGLQTLCGGSLISKRYVLTSARCVKAISNSSSPILKSVRLGEHDTETNPDCIPIGESSFLCADKHVSVEIEEIIPHEDYSPGPFIIKNDIAILRLKRDVHFTGYIKPICLPKSNEQHEEMLFAGWGVTEDGITSTIKKKVTLPLVKIAKCWLDYSKASEPVYLTTGQLCAGNQQNKAACTGDNGGPLMSVDLAPGSLDRVFTLTGIHSFGPSSCRSSDLPNVFAKVDEFIPWILKNLRV